MIKDDMILFLKMNPTETVELLVSVNSLDNEEEEDNILYSLSALFRRNTKQKPLNALKMILVKGPYETVLSNLKNPIFSRFFEKVDFAFNRDDITLPN